MRLLLALALLASPAIGARWTPTGAVVTFQGPGCLALDGGWGGVRPIPGTCRGEGWHDVALETALAKAPTPGDAYLLVRDGAVVGRVSLGDRYGVALPWVGG